MTPLFAVILISLVVILGVSLIVLYRIGIRGQTTPAVVHPPTPGVPTARQAQQPAPRDWKIWKRVGWTVLALAIIGGGYWLYSNASWNGPSHPDWDSFWSEWKWLVWTLLAIMALIVIVRWVPTEKIVTLGIFALIGTVIYLVVGGSSKHVAAANAEKAANTTTVKLTPGQWYELDKRNLGEVQYSFDLPVVVYYIPRHGEPPPTLESLGDPRIPGQAVTITRSEAHRSSLPRSWITYVAPAGSVGGNFYITKK